jgi:hypothetical protein
MIFEDGDRNDIPSQASALHPTKNYIPCQVILPTTEEPDRPEPAYIPGRSIMSTASRRPGMHPSTIDYYASTTGTAASAGAPNPNIPFDHELAYAISCIRYIHDHAPTVSAVENERRKHLDLLDGLALILVTGDTSDVAAVSFQQNTSSIEFFYSKNQPSTATEQQYIESMLKLVKTFDQSKRGQCTSRIVEMSVQACIRKVRSRVKKLVKELVNCGLSMSNLKLGMLGNLQISESQENLVSRAVVQAQATWQTAAARRETLKASDRTALAILFVAILRLDVHVETLREKSFGSLIQAILICYSVGMIDPL